jgi:hypothetical protein
MGKPGSSERVVPVQGHEQPYIGQDRFKEFFEAPVSPEYRRKRDVQMDRIRTIKKREHASRKLDESLIRTYERVLGISKVKRDETVYVLSEEQKQELKTAITESGESKVEQDAIREYFMRSLKEQERFVSLHDKWHKEWEADKDPEKPDFKEFARKKGLEYIKEYAREMRNQRLDVFFDENKDKEGMADEQVEVERKKFREALDMYFQANGVALAGLKSLDDKDQADQKKVLLDAFIKRMTENGFEKIEKAKLEALFNQFVGDFEYEYASYEEYEATYADMVDMVGLNLTPEEWEARRQKALKKNAQGELKEYLQQQAMPVYAGTYEAAPAVFGSIREVENACGVHFDPVSGTPDTYRITAPAVTDRAFAPIMKIVYDPPEKRTMENAVFLIQQRWQDEDARNTSEVINGIPTVPYKPKDAVRGVTLAILNHVINKKINAALPENAKQGTNRLIREDMMVHLAERLLVPFRVGDRPIREDEVNMFQRFMEVVLRDDPNTENRSLQARTKNAMDMVDRDGDLAYLQEIFSSPGSTVRTLSKLEGEIALMRGGQKPENESENRMV